MDDPDQLDEPEEEGDATNGDEEHPDVGEGSEEADETEVEGD